MTALKLTAIGNSTGLILPKELLAENNLEKGDEVFITKTPDGFKVSAYDPEFERQMEVARKVMKKFKPALHELAK